ncbi:MAG TPA: hypothetical protein PLA88_05100 [Bacteroidales bacterium]|nr:hypothetical protein [Bacteroidales bacterium]
MEIFRVTGVTCQWSVVSVVGSEKELGIKHAAQSTVHGAWGMV